MLDVAVILGHALDAEVTEAVERENRLVRPVAGVGGRRLRGTQIVGVERAVLLEHFAVADADDVVVFRVPPEIDAFASGEILPEIDDQCAVFELADGFRLERAHLADELAGLPFDRDVFQCVRIENDRVPVGLVFCFQRGVVVFAVVDVAHDDGAVSVFPGFVRDKLHDRSVGLPDVEFRLENGLVAVGRLVAVAPETRDASRVPPFGEADREDVLRAFADQLRHVVRLILYAVVVVGPAGRHADGHGARGGRRDLFENIFSVQIRFVEPERGDVQARLRDALDGGHFSAEQRHGPEVFAVRLRPDPFRLPRRAEESRLERGGKRIGARAGIAGVECAARLVFHLDGPCIGRERFERFALVFDLDRLAGLDPA